MVSKHCRSSGHIGYTRLWMRFQPMNAGFFKGLLIVFLLFPACLHAVVSITPVCSFYSTNGSFPTCALVQGGDGNFYGTTRYGGPVGYGTVFKIAADGTLATVNSFYGTNGANPAGTLVFGKDGNLYG